MEGGQRCGIRNEGEGQKDWKQIAASQGPMAVQKETWNQAAMWADKLYGEFGTTMKQLEPHIGAGVKGVLEKLIDFQFQGIDAQLSDLMQRVQSRIEEKERL